MKRRILTADSDIGGVRLVKNILSPMGYEILPACSLTDMYSSISSDSPDIIILDPQLTEDGAMLIRRLREWCRCPIIVISGNTAEDFRCSLLDAGADDFLIKPVTPAELCARTGVQLRHIEELESARGLNTDGVFRSGGLEVDYDRHTVTLDGKPVHLTRNEFRITSLLCRYSGRVLSYDHIMRSVWGPQTGSGNGILRVNITNIRRKLERDINSPVYIITESGIGYRMSDGK